MAKRVKKHLEVLKLLKNAKPKLRQSIVASAENDLVQCICECCHNILKGNIKLSPKEKKQLSRHKKPLRDLTSKRLSVERKRKLLVQKGGFLPALLAPIIGIASSLIGGLLR